MCLVTIEEIYLETAFLMMPKKWTPELVHLHAVVANFATTAFRCNSPLLKRFLICDEIAYSSCLKSLAINLLILRCYGKLRLVAWRKFNLEIRRGLCISISN